MAAAAAVSLLSLPSRAAPPSLTFVTCRTTSPSTISNLSPPPLQLALEPKTNLISSSSCALNCRHFQSCSGCTHEYNLHHPPILAEATEFFKKTGVSNFTFDSCRLWGWRCRAKLAVRGSSMKPLIGLYEEGTHNVVDIPECKAHHPSINAAVVLLKRAMAELNIEPYDEDNETGELRYVQVHENSGADDLISSELMPDYRDVFQTMEWFDSRESLINWVRERAIPLGIVVIVRSSKIGSEGRMPRLELCCERSGYPRKSKPKLPKQTCYLEQENMEEVLKKKHESSTKLRKSGSKRIGCPFHLKEHYLGDVGKWSLEVICGIHNHAQARYLEGHAYIGRLTSDEEKLVASLSSTHSRPKEILVALKKRFTNNKSTIKTIYNIRHRQRYEDHAGRSQIQYLLGKLEEYGFYQHIKRCHQTDTVTHMFYAHPKSVQLLRAFPNVLLMDCTSKTNR